MEREGSTRALAESALLAAITVLLMFLGAFLPLAGFLVVLVWPVPVMLVILRHGLRYGIMTVAVTVVLSTIFLGVIQALLAGITIVGLIGVAFGLGLHRGWSASTLVGVGTAVIALSFLITLAVAGPLMGVDLVAQIRESATLSAEMMADTYSSLGVDEGRDIAAEMEMAVDVMETVFPAMLMMSAFLYSIWTFGVTRLILPRMGYPVPHLPSFARWRAPIWLAIALMVSYGVIMLYGGEDSIYPVVLAENVLFAVNGAYLVFGAALLFFLLKRVIQSSLVAGIVTGLITINPLGVSILPLAAILDSGLDIRRFFDRKSAQRNDPGLEEENEEDAK
ncbi:MAG: DUF2232 domain-containing protein [Bacillota bacterium]